MAAEGSGSGTSYDITCLAEEGMRSGIGCDVTGLLRVKGIYFALKMWIFCAV